MLRIRVGSSKFQFVSRSELTIAEGRKTYYVIWKIVEIPSWQLHVFREKQREEPQFNGQLLKNVMREVSAPYIVGPINTSPRTKGCKSCGRFLIKYSSQTFPSEDKFTGLQREVNKVLALLTKMAE